MSRLTPPCPRCGRDVETLGFEQRDDSYSMTASARALPPLEMWVNPCGHPISGYVTNEDDIVVELKP